MGVGIHGEPGRTRPPLKPAAEIADELLSSILADFDFTGAPVIAMLSGLGGTPLIELYAMYGDVAALLEQHGSPWPVRSSATTSRASTWPGAPSRSCGRRGAAAPLGRPRRPARCAGGLGMTTLEDGSLTVDDLIAWMVRFDEQIVEQPELLTSSTPRSAMPTTGRHGREQPPFGCDRTGSTRRRAGGAEGQRHGARVDGRRCSGRSTGRCSSRSPSASARPRSSTPPTSPTPSAPVSPESSPGSRRAGRQDDDRRAPSDGRRPDLRGGRRRPLRRRCSRRQPPPPRAGCDHPLAACKGRASYLGRTRRADRLDPAPTSAAEVLVQGIEQELSRRGTWEIGLVIVTHGPRLAEAAVELALDMVHRKAQPMRIAATRSTIRFEADAAADARPPSTRSQADQASSSSRSRLGPAERAARPEELREWSHR